ncbi:hypothetical protein M422DRAFT_255705 [Sphaerobolus stellatus SS14]|uniref:Uncharacterized protein n=1 Tax=Sphaerobolus stellatus (strain SS14) TaxID=990650 RepID=A0A0C9VIA3_SPHS4|nr:hypothetical protein M422DRAFT_255705 [Sphaerobolus stellatus SS14]
MRAIGYKKSLYNSYKKIKMNQMSRGAENQIATQFLAIFLFRLTRKGVAAVTRISNLQLEKQDLDFQIKELKQGPLAHIHLNGRKPKTVISSQSQVNPSLSYRVFEEVDAPLDFYYEIRDISEAFEPLGPVPAPGTIVDDNFW